MLTWAGEPGKQIPIVEGGVVPSAAQTVAYSFSVAGTREKPISAKIKEYPLLYPNNGASSLSRVNGFHMDCYPSVSLNPWRMRGQKS